MDKKIRCAIYDRVSTEYQVQNGLSLDTQKEVLTGYAKEHGYEIVGYYADEGITARKKLQNRKDFMRLLEDVKRDRIDLILVTKLDRWFRNVKDYHNTQAILEEHHCNWKTILEDYDTTTADGQLKINIMLAVAQNECDRTSERIKVVLEHKRRLGEHVTGAAPYGYKLVNKKLEKDEKTAHIVDDLFTQYFLTFSKRKAIQYISETYSEHGPTVYQMGRMFTNETYAGIYKGNTAYCEPYISYKQLLEIKRNSDARSHSCTREPYVFAGLITCPVCGYKFSGKRARKKCKDGIHEYKKYCCIRKYSYHGGANVSENTVEQYLINNVFREIRDIEYRIEEGKRNKMPKDKVPQIRAEMDRLNILYQKGRISDEYYEDQYHLLETQLREETEKNLQINTRAFQNIKKTFSGGWVDVYHKLNAEHKNAFWRRHLKEINIDKDTHRLCGFRFLI